MKPPFRAQADEAVDGINPLHFLKTLEAFLDDRALLVADGGDFVASAAYTLRPRGPLSWLDPGVFGTLGVGAGFAVGAKLCRPDAEVWLIYGDGSAGYTLAEFDTLVRHKLPVIAVVGNDAGWSQIARDQVTYLQDDVATVLAPTAYDQVVEGLGAKGIRIARAGRDRAGPGGRPPDSGRRPTGADQRSHRPHRVPRRLHFHVDGWWFRQPCVAHPSFDDIRWNITRTAAGAHQAAGVSPSAVRKHRSISSRSNFTRDNTAVICAIPPGTSLSRARRWVGQIYQVQIQGRDKRGRLQPCNPRKRQGSRRLRRSWWGGRAS